LFVQVATEVFGVASRGVADESTPDQASSETKVKRRSPTMIIS